MFLISSAAVGLFYLQATCESILRREFDHVRLRSFANSCRLEFFFVVKEIEESGGVVDNRRVRAALKCDYLALTFLLKNAAGTGSGRERILMVYFRVLFFVASVQQLAGVKGERVIEKLSNILRHFAGLLSEQAHQIQFDNLTA